MKKKVLIRAGGIIPQKGSYISGIGRSNVELVQALLKVDDPDMKFSIYCTTLKSLGFKHYGWPIEYHAFPFPHKLMNVDHNWESLYRQKVFGYDLFHLTNNFDNVRTSENFVVTIHDMFMYRGSDWNRQMFHKCMDLSKGIVTCSNFTKEDIVEIGHVDPDKITVIPWGISHKIFYPRPNAEIDSTLKKFGIRRSYLFTCSCANPRKNARVLLAAYKKAQPSMKDVSLVLVWNHVPQDILDEYAAEIEAGDIIFTPFVTDDELACLYSGALATYFISSFEGFGFPIIESFACGTPCVTCKNTSLTEVGADKAIFVKEKDIDDTADSMVSIYEHTPDNREELMQYASQYNWEHTGAEYIKFYKKYV